MSGKRYDVFISHRGDIKRSFVSFLRRSLGPAHTCLFVDETSLQPGVDGWKTITEALRDCYVALPVLTASYGESEWCLEELSIMMEARTQGTVDVLPVFLDDDGVGVLDKIRAAVTKSARPEVARWLEAIEKVGNITGLRLDQTGG